MDRQQIARRASRVKSPAGLFELDPLDPVVARIAIRMPSRS
jgi:hypothetical protein